MRIISMLVMAMVAVFGLPFMAVLTADRQTQSRVAGLKSYPVSVDIIYKGGIVAVNEAGYLAAATDAANDRVVGVADENVDNSGGSAGDKNCRVVSGRAFLFAATAITQAMVGDLMHVVDDQTFDDSGGTNSVPCGRLVEFVTTTSGWIYIPKGGLRKAGAADATYSANEQAILNDILT